MLFEFLSEQEQEFFLQQEVDEIEECKKMIKFCDLQILKFMKKNKRTGTKSRWTCGIWCKQEKKTEGLHTQEEITTNTVAVHELILRYNNEIEKAKKQKMKCLEVLLKFGETQNQQTEQTTAVNIYLPNNDRG